MSQNIIKQSKDIQNTQDSEDHGKLLYSWSTKEHEEVYRSLIWYIIFGVAITALSIYCIVDRNYLFLIIVIMFALLEVMFKFKKPEQVNFSIYEDGIEYNNKNFFFWDLIKEFYIIYEPERNVKKIYFIFNKVSLPSISIDLGKENPLEIKKILINYIPENIERKYEHLSDQIGRFFKL